jgi:plastocyanin
MIFILLFCIATGFNFPGNEPYGSIMNHKAQSQNAGIMFSRTEQSKPAVDTVSISMMAFHPAEIHVHKGDTLIWVNDDLVSHCVTEFPDQTWTSGLISMGGSWKMAVMQSCDYFCAIHQVMKGKIIVE